jgi:hypothetical protein
LKQFIGKSNPFKETMSPFDGGLKEGEGICFSSVLGYWIGLRLKTSEKKLEMDWDSSRDQEFCSVRRFPHSL